MLASLSMESLAGSGYRAGGYTCDGGLAAVWHPCHTRESRKPVVPETLGFKGSETAGRHGHVSIKAFQKTLVRYNGGARWKRLRVRYSVIIILVHGRQRAKQ